ncbi:MAG: sensor histidine kinase [Solirubrobacteraceae bacterium]
MLAHHLIPAALRTRLVLAAAGSILAAMAVFGVATAVLLRHELRGSLDQALRRRAQEVAELAVSAPAVLTYSGGLESPVSGRQIAVEVLDARGRILARSLALAPRLLPQDQLAAEARLRGLTGFEDRRVGGLPYRLYAAPIAQAGGPAAGGAVLVAADTAEDASTIGHLELVLALSGVGLALLAALGAAGLTRRGLKPLRRLAGAAGEIERTADAARRLPESGAADEIGQLTGVLNRMLASLERSRETERRFLADASHELRTPVTTLLGNVEYAARHGADPEVLADLQRDAARLARLVDDLLVLERAGSPARERELVGVELDRLAHRVANGYVQKGAAVRIGGLEPVSVAAEPDSLARALEKLIDNALAHGPAGGEVTITVMKMEGGGRALLTVSDRGPGPDPAHREHLFERFWRGTDASERPGSGLGLSIVAAIVERHAGRIVVDGAAFTVELPVLEGHLE